MLDNSTTNGSDMPSVEEPLTKPVKRTKQKSTSLLEIKPKKSSAGVLHVEKSASPNTSSTRDDNTDQQKQGDAFGRMFEAGVLHVDKSASPITSSIRDANTDQSKQGLADLSGDNASPALIERVTDYDNESTKTKAGSFPSRNPATADLSGDNASDSAPALDVPVTQLTEPLSATAPPEATPE